MRMSSDHRWSALVALGLTALFLSGCRPADERRQVGDAAAWAIGPDPVISIGEVEGEAPYLFSGVASVRLLPDGRLIVADRGSHTLRIYDADGRFERQFGREGDGPGEFRYLSGMRIAGPDTVIVFDSDLYRLSRFLVSGELLSTVTFRVDGWAPDIYLGQLEGGTDAFASMKRVFINPNVTVSDSFRIGRFEAGRLHVVLGVVPGMRRRGSPLPFSPHFVAGMVGDTIFYSDGLGSLILAMGPDGRIVRSIRLPLEAWSPEEAYARLQPHLDSMRLRRVKEARELHPAEEIPTISEILAGAGPELWVKRYDPATDSHAIFRPLTGGEWLVIDTGGRVMARVAVPEGVRLMDISRGQVAGVMRDEFDVERVIVFPLRRG